MATHKCWVRAAQVFKAQEALQQMAHNRRDYGKKANKLISLLAAGGKMVGLFGRFKVFFQTTQTRQYFQSEMTGEPPRFSPTS